MPQNVFVLGLDEMNLRMLRELPHLARYRFHRLLSIAELQRDDAIVFPQLLEQAQTRLDSFTGPVDAIIGFWDFPVSSMVPILCARYGLRSASLEAVVKCEHKYWSRIEQREVIDEYPPFGLVDLSGEGSVPPPGVRFPMWLKPVKSTASALAFRVRDEHEFGRAVARIRAGIPWIGEPFGDVLAHLDLPPEIADVGPMACLAEESIDGAQVTVEGYATGGDVHVYGVVDSIHYPDVPSFLRYQYPSSLPEEVVDRMTRISVRVIRRLGLDATTFNIEYFWNRETDAITLLEVNPRHSQSHAPLFEYVDGVPNHQYMVRLALGLEPEPPRGRGRYKMAAKWFIRRRADCLVRRVPSKDEIAAVEREVPGALVYINARAGERLSDLSLQDSYSYEVARVFVGADDETGLKAKYETCVAGLPFEFDE